MSLDSTADRRSGIPRAPAGYLDAASGEPLHPAAVDILRELLGTDEGDPDPLLWVDPYKRYGSARRARILADGATERMAALLGCRADEVQFTSSGTQAVQLAVLGSLLARPRTHDLAIATAVEHSAVLQAVRQHERAGGRALIVGVDDRGHLDLESLARAVGSSGAAVASVQSANHEVGSTQPVAEAVDLCQQAGVPLMVDAAQSVGRAQPVPSGWSLLTASAHKWGGPAGLGVLAIRSGTRWTAPLPGNDLGGRWRDGFPTVALAAAAVAALAAVNAAASLEDARLARLTGLIRTRLPASIPDCVVLGDETDRLPHIVTASFLYVDGEALLDELDRAGFATSSGSSCAATTLTPSHVLEAMGALTHGNLRISLPRGVSAADVERFLAMLPDVVARLRDAGGAPRS